MKIGIVGLGYVGLPLACAFAREFQVVGYDTNTKRIDQLNRGTDRNGQVEPDDRIHYVSHIELLTDCDLVIVCVPTPVNSYRQPDIRLLERAYREIGELELKDDAVVVLESTVYPGLTRRLSEKYLRPSTRYGYSPERINPGDEAHPVEKITKIIAASDPSALGIMREAYGKVIERLHEAPSIEVAEAAKITENIQRDTNIALMNELAVFYERCAIPMRDVLAAAGTKWNFLKFNPGLVGGHCISVDPFYLTFLARRHGVHLRLVEAARDINERMPAELVQIIIKRLKCIPQRVLIYGLTYKKNVPDFRNSKVVDLKAELESYGCHVDIYDPLLDENEVRQRLGFTMCMSGDYSLVIKAVNHDDSPTFKGGRCPVFDLEKDL